MDLYGKVKELEERIYTLEQAIARHAAEQAVAEKVKAAAKQKRGSKE